jgi:GTP 3',8-cyclase
MATRPASLRVSVTDRCNQRCQYCRPALRAEAGRGAPLSDDALVHLIGAIARAVPVRKIRLTGGEPLLRPALGDLVGRLRDLLPSAELALTTNAALLPALAGELRRRTLDAINISVDTLEPARFRRLTGGALGPVLAGIEAARAAGFSGLKLNAVLMRSINGERLPELVRFAASAASEIRFIELMPVGAGAALFAREYLPVAEALAVLRGAFEYVAPLPRSSNAERHLFDVGGARAAVGLIAPVSHPFCSTCDRLRLDARGRLFPCLRRERSIDLAPLLANGASGVAFAVRRAIDSKRVSFPMATEWSHRSMAATGG